MVSGEGRPRKNMSGRRQASANAGDRPARAPPWLRGNLPQPASVAGYLRSNAHAAINTDRFEMFPRMTIIALRDNPLFRFSMRRLNIPRDCPADRGNSS
jgi:hypothetical protein